MEEKHGPYATREDIQVLRADLIEKISDVDVRLSNVETRLSERIGAVETRLSDRISRIEGQLISLNRVNYAIFIAILIGLVKMLFFAK